MRILEVNKFNHVRGGADKHFVDLANLLQENGNEVAVFAMDHPENIPSEWSKYFVSRVDYENGSALNKIKGALRIFWSFEARRKIGKLLDEFQPEIVHIHNIYHQISPSILSEIKKRGIPVVMTVHDWKMICPNYLLNCGGKLCEKCVGGKYWHCLKNKCVKKSYLKSLISMLEMYFHRFIRVYEKNIDLYIAPSQFVKDNLAKAGFSESRIKVLPHFAKAVDARRLLNMQSNNYALYLGRVSKEKGVDELIEIFKDLPIDLVLAGKRDSDFMIPDLPNIKHVGFKPSQEIESLIRNSQFVVSASQLPETFGLIALEAIANQKPFIGYRAGAYGEIVRNGVNGSLAESKGELKSRIEEFLVNKNRKYYFDISRFSPEKYHQSIIDIFRSLC
ncbi:MAG: glycosyltransferase [Candidatus Moranbacteria bacterium]|nr:glycosyltransferase [Candidatus Moranbacteria bacterium]